MSDYADVPPEIVARLRTVCLGFPEAHEEQAWTGTRWRIRKRTFAHVLAIDSAWPPAYAKAIAPDGPVTVLTMRAPIPELDALTSSGHPFYRPQWGHNVLGMIIDSDTDWPEVAELVERPTA
jgi:hypothetical protein